MRKRKIGIIAFLSILNIPVSIVFSTIIHSKLSNIAISQIVVDKQILLLFFLIYMLIETTIIILFGFGSKNVFELHGSVHRNYCQKCGKFFDVNYVVNAKGVPYCDECGGIIKPDVVLYEEGLDSQTINGAVRAISKADMLIIGGTSLVVYPAAGMIDYFKGKYLAVLNRDATSRDKQADLCITDPIGEVLGRIRV